ncbi:AMMECR1 domain-containing protein [Turneriella parva]|uniref:AMMECR1 domain protein n=1 Tax=Turneriella parva (strain ATCC BAA-1111 / DSM 21527 / NCTC 11395 / H) TaxID=869212 RepID=I4B1W1_TURPD|nr:AMMECR1 domain-containing protein [Turneriella parva]AFM11268.1 AMMECR1 domain protein [Turneriella parva DSM 21527]
MLWRHKGLILVLCLAGTGGIAAETPENMRAALESVSERVVAAMLAGDPIIEDAPARALLKTQPSRKGMFVSIFDKKTRRLRGCMGSLVAQRANLYDEVTHWTTMALMHDTRTARPRKNAEYLVIISFVDHIEPVVNVYEINAIQHGILVRQRGREELVLPGEAFTTAYALKMISQKLQNSAEAEGSEYFRIHAERFGKAIALFKKFDGGYGG